MGKRHSIKGKGIPSHPQPFPTAIRIGNMVFSSAIGGHDPETRQPPKEKEAQITQAFVNMRAIVETAGGTVDDIGKVVVYLRDKGDRDLVNAEWTRMFPDDDDRPVRHTVTSDLPGRLFIQLEFVAVL